MSIKQRLIFGHGGWSLRDNDWEGGAVYIILFILPVRFLKSVKKDLADRALCKDFQFYFWCGLFNWLADVFGIRTA